MSTLNYKVADEIETLKTMIEQITSENNQMKIILEMKQTEWIEGEKKQSIQYDQVNICNINTEKLCCSSLK